MQKVRLRQTEKRDLPFVLGAELADENRRFIIGWSKEEHLKTLNNPSFGHLIVEATPSGRSVGYVILAGLNGPNGSIEFKRIVITEKGQGLGRAALKEIKNRVFETLEAHRLWLDVLERNTVARSLYKSEGFLVEGTLRECIKTANGYESLVLMSLLASEYRRADGI